MIRGSVHWAELDKRRPVIILSPEARNETAHDVLLVPCSTSGRPMGWHVPLRRGEAGLPQACAAHCEKITLVRKDRIDTASLGLLSPGRMREIEMALLSALGIEV